MKIPMILMAIAGVMTCATASNASVAFSFADPSNGRQLTNAAGGGASGDGQLSYDIAAPLTFIVDGTTSGLGTASFNAHLELTMDLGVATTTGSVTIAPVTGAFTVFTGSGASRVNLLTGTATSGAYVRVGGTNSMLLSSPGFVYTAGPGLAPILGGNTLSPAYEAVFTVTDLNYQGSLIDGNGQFTSFTSNASYSGNAGLAPAPGALALGAVGVLVVARRRRA